MGESQPWLQICVLIFPRLLMIAIHLAGMLGIHFLVYYWLADPSASTTLLGSTILLFLRKFCLVCHFYYLCDIYHAWSLAKCYDIH